MILSCLQRKKEKRGGEEKTFSNSTLPAERKGFCKRREKEEQTTPSVPGAPSNGESEIGARKK